MELSVIIVSYNVRHFLEQCLVSVRKAASGLSCEIFVVDNSSADGSCAMVRTKFPEVKLIPNPDNKGFSAACNQAIKLSSSPFTLLLNPDTVVEEDTFKKCIGFMNDHPDAGAMGVKMISGNGKLLPESKRALPTPATAFFKMSGLAWLFPKSRIFNRYYLGHLNSTATSEADILSGAFMFIRKKVLDITGLLDETFFMYGEDIDLSYRIIKAGYKNYYYPGVSIIHYKGESTRKEELDYFLHFYRAMLIFIKKHFGKKGSFSFLLPLRVAIYFWGFVTFCKSLIKKIILPLADAAIISLSLSVIIRFWENFKFGREYSYPDYFEQTFIPASVLISLLSVLIAGGYKLPSRIKNVVRGILVATGLILVIYALLPQEVRFSRAIPVFGGIVSVVVIPLYRLLLAAAGLSLIENPFAKARRTVIVSDEEGFIKVSRLLAGSSKRHHISGRVSINRDDFGTDVLGNIDQLKEVVRINRIKEVIFSTKLLSASQIITSMHLLSESNVIIQIAPSGEDILIGSKSVIPGNDQTFLA
jgi:O-antigen biosynthesis protein